MRISKVIEGLRILKATAELAYLLGFKIGKQTTRKWKR